MSPCRPYRRDNFPTALCQIRVTTESAGTGSRRRCGPVVAPYPRSSRLSRLAPSRMPALCLVEISEPTQGDHDVKAVTITECPGHRHAAGELLELPSVNRGELRAWDTDQIGRFLGHVESDRLGPLWRFVVATGVRRGEALGLRWSDVDLDARSVSIRRSRVVAGGRVVEGQPKTKAGVRTIATDAATTTVLRSWKAAQSSERLLMGAGWGNAVDLVFTQPDGTPLYPQTITASAKRIAIDLGLPTIGVHGLRHSSATMMMSSGLSPKVVSQRLGHATVAITLDTDSHVLPAHDQAAADLVGRSLDGADQAVPRDSVTRL